MISYKLDGCKVMYFGKKDHNNTDYYMNGQRLLTLTEEQDLGDWSSYQLRHKVISTVYPSLFKSQ